MARNVLLIAACLSIAIALLHVIIVFMGAPGYRYFGAGEEIARRAESGSLFPAALTLLIAVVFGVFAAYALSGAGVLRRLPLLRLGLLAIGAIYTLRGLSAIRQCRYLIQHHMSLLHRVFVFSMTSLIIGIIYLAGTMLAWKSLSSPYTSRR